jgi:large subunit ribosomal protein L10
MLRSEKTQVVEDLKRRLANASALVLADYRGINVEAVNKLRREFRGQGCEYKVVKNTLLRLAVEGTPLAVIRPLLEGPTALGIAREDPTAAARVATKYAKEEAKFVIKGGFADGQLLDADGVKALATMPGKDELRAKLLATLVAVPQAFLRLLSAAPTSFLYLLSARERALPEQQPPEQPAEQPAGQPAQA